MKALANVVSTLPTVLIAVVAMAVMSVPVTTVDYDNFISYSYLLCRIASLAILDTYDIMMLLAWSCDILPVIDPSISMS